MSRFFRRTVDEVIMFADPDVIFRMAAEVERWGEILPHYRWVKVLGEHSDGRVVEMAAMRGLIPVKWVSEQVVDTEKRRVHYHHTGGLTRGMDVEWSLDCAGDSVRVKIIHEMTLTAPIVGTAIGRWITGRFFVHHIAKRTLRKIKEIAEERR